MNDIAKVDPQGGALRTVAATPADMVTHFMANGASLEQLDKLFDLQQKWEADQARKAYVDGMAQFKLNPPKIIKDKLVEFSGTRYTHATLGAVTEAIVAGLAEHGFSHRWDTKQDGGTITVTCIITHRMGHSESTSLSSGKDDSGKKNQIQQIASAQTYLQRYTLLAATGIATHDQQDDDGQGYGLDTKLADKWIAEVNKAKDEAAMLEVWNRALVDIRAADDGFAYDEVKRVYIERRSAFKGAK